MYFEWDDNKNEINELKHGVPLSFGCELWNGRVFSLKANRNKEKRLLSIGRIGGEYWSVIWEDKGEVRRLISVRPSSVKERSLYDYYDSL